MTGIIKLSSSLSKAVLRGLAMNCVMICGVLTSVEIGPPSDTHNKGRGRKKRAERKLRVAEEGTHRRTDRAKCSCLRHQVG